MIGIAEQRTYNFSVTGLTFDDKVIDGASYQLLAGQNVVEVMQGDVFNPVKNINYNGIMRYWGVQDDLTSYTASSEALEFYIDTITNGGSSLSQVAPSTGYTSIEDIKNDFLAAVANIVVLKYLKFHLILLQIGMLGGVGVHLWLQVKQMRLIQMVHQMINIQKIVLHSLM
ncbi:MAG: hypothetical protein ACLU5J_02440 [Christensenellales bacterium]